MSKQPEALWLADFFDGLGQNAASTELRRQHALIAELVEALERLSGQCNRLRLPGYPQSDAERNAIAVLSKAKEQS